MKTVSTYYYHVNPQHQVRIKVCEKTVTWERLQTNGKWKYDTRKPLPVTNAETLRTMYSLPDDVVAKLNGAA